VPKKTKDADRDADRERVLRALREIIDTPGTSSRVLAARYAASMRLAKLTGMDVELEPDEVEPPTVPDPMADLDELEMHRRRRARR
jgi:hypothetical protein